MGDGDTRQLSLPGLYPLQPMAEADVRPQREELFSHIFQGNMEHIRTHMGLGVHEDALRRAAGNQLLQDEAMARILGAGV